MPTAADLAMEILHEWADETLVAMIESLMHSGAGVWVFDPEVDRVVGFVKPGTNRAAVVVYLNDNDFETDENLEELLEQWEREARS